MFDYPDQYRQLRADIREAIDRVLASGQLILGPEVRRFGSSFAEFLGGGYGVGVNSGTDALAVALKTVGTGPGDEVHHRGQHQRRHGQRPRPAPDRYPATSPPLRAC